MTKVRSIKEIIANQTISKENNKHCRTCGRLFIENRITTHDLCSDCRILEKIKKGIYKG